MIWTSFSAILFVGLGVMASHSIGGFAYVALLLVSTVILIKAAQDTWLQPEYTPVNPFRQ